MDFQLTSEQQRLQNKCRELTSDFVTRTGAHDRDASHPVENYDRLRKEGFLALTVGKEWGGLGASFLDHTIAYEALGEGCPSTAVAFNMHASVVMPVLENAQVSAETKRRHCRSCRAAEQLITGNFFEPVATSLIGERPLKVRARRAAGGYRVTGRKMFGSRLFNPLTARVDFLQVFAEDGEEMATPMWQWSAVDTAAAIRDGRATSEEVVQAHIDRMHAANPALNAIVVDLSAQAIEAARAADRALAQGAAPGKLQGVPVTIKINIDFEGQANSNGVVAFKDNIAPGDSPVTANLKKAGAIIIGMTNTPEFSMRGFTDNPLHGPTLNPWDRTITCGGSSGGAGASIASGIGAIAHGNDIGGSLRWPAYCNGIATIKPTQGRIPAFNPSAPVERPLIAQFMSAQGPLAREVRDVRLGLEVMSQRDMRDPWWVPAPLEGPSLAKPIKVALARIPDDMETDAAVLALLRTAAGHLVDAGYDVVETEVPDLTGTWKLWCDLIMTELSVLQEVQMRELGSADFRQTLDGFLKMATILDRRGYMEAIAYRSRVLRGWLAFLESYPVILTPLSVQRTPEANADLGGDARVHSLFWNDLRFMSSINVLGLPAAVVPIGLVAGNPVGVQLIGSRYREDICLDAAAAIEAKVGIMAKRLWERI